MPALFLHTCSENEGGAQESAYRDYVFSNHVQMLGDMKCLCPLFKKSRKTQKLHVLFQTNEAVTWRLILLQISLKHRQEI